MNRFRREDVLEGLRHLARHPLRSVLTAVTCAVAIAVTVNVISLSYGLDDDVRRDIAKFGRLTIDVGRTPLIRPGAVRPPFGEAELAKIRAAVDGLSAVVVPLRTERATARGDAEAERIVLAAAGPSYPETLKIDLAAGRWLAPSDRGFSACVLDRSVASSLFPGVTPAAVVGRSIALVREPAVSPVVVGILDDPMTHRAVFEAFDEGRSSRTLAGALLSFRNVYVPEDALGTPDLTMVHVVLPDERRLALARERLVALWPETSVDLAADRIPPITVFERKTWIDAFGGVSQTGAFLGNIVWILVVFVACVMVSTQNLITIRERYDEVALRRCEGARKAHLVTQVTTEGLVTSVAGGLLGLPVGYLGAEALRRLVDFPFRFEARYAGVAVLVSVFLGLLSSVVPARRAAGLDPARVLSRRLT
jgi:putative ABC transport system permease protein